MCQRRRHLRRRRRRTVPHCQGLPPPPLTKARRALRLGDALQLGASPPPRTSVVVEASGEDLCELPR
jgi:hypothetical protein